MKRPLILFLLLLVLAACGQTTAASWTEADLTATGSPLAQRPEELAGWLSRVANADKGPLLPWLQAVVGHWYPGQQGGVKEADLDGNGQPEVVLSLNAEPAGPTAPGGIFVIYEKDGKYVIDASLNPADDNSTIVILQGVADLTGDGRPEIIWSLNGHGAHTSYATVLVSRWTPGQLAQLPGAAMHITSMSLKIDGQDLLLTGGEIGSAGAGIVQRAWTDRFRWVNGAIAHIDRSLAVSEFSYHRLEDGIVAETFHRLADARAAFAQALESGRTVLMPGAVDVPEAENLAKLATAVQAFARFRLGALLLRDAATVPEGRTVLQDATGPFAGLSEAMLNAADRTSGCQAAITWASAHPGFLDALNSPLGYANPKWSSSDLCEAMPGA